MQKSKNWMMTLLASTVLALAACTPIQAPTPEAIGEVAAEVTGEATVEATAEATEAATAEAEQTPMGTETPVTLGETMSFENAFFIYDPALAGDWASATLGENRAGELEPPSLEAGPPRLVFTAVDYAGPTENRVPPTIYIYNVEDFASEEGTSLESEVAEQLATLLEEQPDLETVDTLPFLPDVAGGQFFHAREMYVPFDQGEGMGISYLTGYSLDVAPIQPSQLWYTFQGLTDNGEVYVSAVFPVDSDLFSEELPADFDYDAFVADLDQYLAETTETLTTMPADDFTPNLQLLDSLVQSVVVE